ncbi:MAG: hypothetical protein V5A18_10865 [Haloarculaceae archaeon]
MTGATVRLEPATRADLDAVVTLLSANDLPIADVRSGTGSFYLAYEDDRRMGVGGRASRTSRHSTS